MSVAKISSLVGLGMPPALAGIVGAEWASKATAGSSQSTATACTTKCTLATGAGGSTDGVALKAMGLNEVAVVKNQDNATMYVYPSSSTGTFNSGAAAAGVQIAAYAAGVFIQRTSTNVIALEIPAA